MEAASLVLPMQLLLRHQQCRLSIATKKREATSAARASGCQLHARLQDMGETRARRRTKKDPLPRGALRRRGDPVMGVCLGVGLGRVGEEMVQRGEHAESYSCAPVLAYAMDQKNKDQWSVKEGFTIVTLTTSHSLRERGIPKHPAKTRLEPLLCFNDGPAEHSMARTSMPLSSMRNARHAITSTQT
jgi:hypothetical protein